jgi:iron(III) transport system permease protein
VTQVLTTTMPPRQTPERNDARPTSGGRLAALGRHLGPRLGLLVFLAALVYVVLLPLARLQILAFENGAEGYRTVYTGNQVWQTVTTTVLLAAGSLAIAMVCGVALAWAATRLPGRLRFLRVLPIVPIVVPAVASVTGWAFMLSPRPGYLNVLLRQLPWWSHLDEGPINVYTLPWIIIVTGIALTSFVYLFVSTGLENINAELLDAASTCGSGQLGTFFRVILPILRPVLTYGAGVALLLGLGQFTGPLLLGTSTGVRVLTTDMYVAVSQTPSDYGAAAAIGSPLLLFGIAVVVVQKLVLGDQSRFVTHGEKGYRAPATSSVPAAVAIVLFCVLAVVLPVVGLLVVSLSPFWTSRFRLDLVSLGNYRELFHTPAVTDAIQNSVVISLIAVALTLPAGYACARILLVRSGNRLVRTVVDFVVALPLGVPAVIFGVGFLLAYSRGPVVLYGSRWVVILVYVTLMLPFATRMLLSGMVALGERYIEAARVSGASAGYTLVRVWLPMLRPAFGGAAALIFVMLANEFAASLLVRTPTTQVMGTVLFDKYANGTFPLVAALALVMTLITAAGMAIAVLVGGGNAFRKL